MPSGIYKFENNINHMVYIGQTIDLEKRYLKHCRNIKDLRKQEDLYRALREFGLENFSYEILVQLDSFDQDRLNELENYYINYYNSLKPNGYNMVPGGTNGAGLAKGKRVQQYDLKGEFIAEFPSAHEADRNTGIDFSSICACCRGERLYTKEFQWKYADDNKKISDISQEVYLKNRKIQQYNLNKELIQEFNNLKEASQSVNVTKSSLCRCLKGHSASCGGFLWSYEGEEIQKERKKYWNGKKVGQYDKNNNLIKIYNSAMEAYRETGISNKNIGKVCAGKATQAGGYIWKFII